MDQKAPSSIVHVEERHGTPPVETASDVVLRAVANHTGRDILDLPVLYEYIDPDSLNNSVRQGRSVDVTPTVEFIYSEWAVRVVGEDRVEILEG